MSAPPFWQLCHLSDSEVLTKLETFVGSERQALARVIAHLAEVQERRLDLRAGCSSLFDYCVRRLGLSEGEAFRRVTAARLARRFPSLFAHIASGALHLTAVCLLRDHLSSENHEHLLEQASHKTKKQVEALIACHFPRPHVASSIRKLPPPRPPLAAPQRALETALQPPAPEPARASNQTRLRPQLQTQVQAQTLSPTEAHPHTDPRCTDSHLPRIDPLSSTHYRIQLNAHAELKLKLERARDLMSHSNPSGDLSLVVERALDLLIRDLERTRFGKGFRRASSTKAPPVHQRVRRPAVPGDAKANPKSSITAARATAPANSMRRTADSAASRHIPSATRRAVFARDAARCTFVDGEGQRCTATRFLELHHQVPWATGGDATPANIRLLCRSHNRLLAEQDFGHEHVQQRIAERRGNTRRPQASRPEAWEAEPPTC